MPTRTCRTYREFAVAALCLATAGGARASDDKEAPPQIGDDAYPPVVVGDDFQETCAQDSPPYHHDGRLLTLEDTVAFFNLVLQLELTDDEETALTAFMRQL